MKYRVKYKCYWYNTGAADNCHYETKKDFDTMGEAQSFRDKVNEQFKMNNNYNSNKITFKEFKRWEKKFKPIDVENGYISSEAKIVKLHEEKEEEL
jgi:hypothetical protein